MAHEYVELHARSASSFLRGACYPESLVLQAAALDIPALALCDRDGVYGAPRFNTAASQSGIQAIIGSELTLNDGSVLPVLAASRTGYNNLCRLITRAKLRGNKEHAPVNWNELEEFSEGLIALTGDAEGPVRKAIAQDNDNDALSYIQRLTQSFGHKNVYIEVQRHLQRGEEYINDKLFNLADVMALPLLATNGVAYAKREQHDILDIFTCIRNHTNLDHAGRLLADNDERYLKPAKMMRRLFADRPDACDNTLRLAERIDFRLENMGYEFPRYPVPPGETMESFLRRITFAGARSRYSHLPKTILNQLNSELDLICKLGFSGYFLIVWDIVNFATEQGILIQGRGSAANSVVCYALGITAVDPVKHELLFERFLSEGRKSWPDIDLDLPSGERREQVIQEVYSRYGKLGAAMTANVITFQSRMTMREVGKALSFPEETISRFSKITGFRHSFDTRELQQVLEKAGLPISHPRSAIAASLWQRIHGLPRHLGQHSGGMIICQGQLDSIVPLENASMPGRVVAQWDKRDCEELGIIKVDLLGLGMMAALQDSLEMASERGKPFDIAQIPKDDPATFDLLCRADTIGTFQVESRAQMATLPRMKPKTFYDVAIEVAIIRPGPIQGGLKHPYLERRAGRQKITYYDERLIPVLKRTLGVPLFQEQLLKMAMIMADYSGSEAEDLRKAMSFARSRETMERVTENLRNIMSKKSISPEVIDKVVNSIQSFALYGFPESHAISFGLLAYTSCWLKVHRTAEFYCGLANNMPMGFYSLDTLIKDAKRRGIKVQPVSVIHSNWRTTVINDSEIRLGLCCIKKLKIAEAEEILKQRNITAFISLADFQLRTCLGKPALRQLAAAGALNGLAQHRRDAMWKVETEHNLTDLFGGLMLDDELPLDAMNLFERMQADYRCMGLTVGQNPMAYVRHKISHLRNSEDLKNIPSGEPVQIAGLIICKQHPATAKGFVFLSLEDEKGIANIVITPQLYEKYRLLITQENFLCIKGVLQNEETVIHVKASKIEPFYFPETATPPSHDFR